MELQVIGKDIIRKEAWKKVTGEALYNADISSPGLLQHLYCGAPQDF